MLVGLVLIHKLIEATPRNLLQYAVEYTIVVLHGLILLRVPKRRQTLGTQKNQCHAPCPPKLNRTAVGLTRPSIPLRKKFSEMMDCRVKPGNDRRRKHQPRAVAACAFTGAP